MFYNPQRVILGTDSKGTPYEVWVSGHKKFMLCGTTYEDEEATRRILAQDIIPRPIITNTVPRR